MTEAVDLYAAPTSDLEGARRLFEDKLQVALGLHDSSWRGGDYYLGFGIGNERFTLQHNRLGRDEVSEEEFRDADIILYVEGTTRSSEILGLLEAIGFRRLRHKET
jgi:hypothetical protein